MIAAEENILSCFIMTQDVDKHAFKITIQSNPGNDSYNNGGNYVVLYVPRSEIGGTCPHQFNGDGAYGWRRRTTNCVIIASSSSSRPLAINWLASL